MAKAKQKGSSGSKSGSPDSTAKSQSPSGINGKAALPANGSSSMTADEYAALRAAHKQLVIDNEQLADQVARLQAQVRAANDAEFVWKNAYNQASWWSYANGALLCVAVVALVASVRVSARAA